MASRYSCLLEPEPPWKTKKTVIVRTWAQNSINPGVTYRASCQCRQASQRRRPGACRAARGAGGRCRGHRHRERCYPANSQYRGNEITKGESLPEASGNGEVLGDGAESLLARGGLAYYLTYHCGKRTFARYPRAECRERRCQPEGRNSQG